MFHFHNSFKKKRLFSFQSILSKTLILTLISSLYLHTTAQFTTSHRFTAVRSSFSPNQPLQTSEFDPTANSINNTDLTKMDSKERHPVYILQVQPDWQIPLQHNAASTLPSSLPLTGANHDQYDLALPTAHDGGVSKVWVNITRVDENNQHDTIYHNLRIDRTTSHSPTDLPQLSSDVLQVTDLKRTPVPATQTSSFPPPPPHHHHHHHHRDSISMHLFKALPDRDIINVTVFSPTFHNQHLHSQILHKKSLKSLDNGGDEDTHAKLRLRPGDLADDEDEILQRLESQTNNNKTSKSTLTAPQSQPTNTTHTTHTLTDTSTRKDDSNPNLDPIHKSERFLEFKSLVSASNNQIEDTFSTHFTPFLAGKRGNGIPVVNVVRQNPLTPFLVLSGAENGDLRLWNADSGQVIKVLHENAQNGQDQPSSSPNPQSNLVFNLNNGCHQGDITCIEWLHNGVLALTGSIDCTIKLWAIELGKCIKTFRGHSRGVVSMKQHFSKKNIFVSLGKDGKVNVYDTTIRGEQGLWPVQSYSIFSEKKIDDEGITFGNLILHPYFDDLVYFPTSVGLFALLLDRERLSLNTATENANISPVDREYGLKVKQTQEQGKFVPILNFPDLSIGCFNTNGSHNPPSQADCGDMDDVDCGARIESTPKFSNTLYLGSATGDIIILDLDSIDHAGSIHSRHGGSTQLSKTAPQTTPEKINSFQSGPKFSTFSFFDENITDMHWYNDNFFICTFSGDCCAISGDFATQTLIFTATDQPMRSISVAACKKAESDSKDVSQLVGCGDDGVFVWTF